MRNDYICDEARMIYDDSDSKLTETRVQVEAEAAKRGKVARYPGPCEVFVDLDNKHGEDSLAEFHRRYELVKRTIGALAYAVTPSATPGNYHVIVTMNSPVPDDTSRLLLQAILGSDPMREAVSYKKLRGGCESAAVSVFFEKPEV
jgi:hypothetical protein